MLSSSIWEIEATLTNPPANLTRDEVLMLPAIERISYVHKIRIDYPRLQKIYTRFKNCYQRSRFSTEPVCFSLVGLSGAGKTTVAKGFASEFPPVITSTSVIRPVLYMSLPAPATVKGVASSLLATLGDPRAFNSDSAPTNHRLINFLRDCKVELIILDELQHLIDRDTETILRKVSDWLKHLIKDTGIACVLVGLQNESEKVIDHNPQLLRLFGDPIILHPFQWDITKKETIAEYRRFLKTVEELLPLKEKSDLAQPERAWRCHVATEGLVGYTMLLIRTATEFALENGKEYLDDSLLADAFDYALGGKSRGIKNSFRGEAPAYRSPEERAISQAKVGTRTNRNRRS